MFLTAKGELINMCEMYEQALRVLVADFVCLAERNLERVLKDFRCITISPPWHSGCEFRSILSMKFHPNGFKIH